MRVAFLFQRDMAISCGDLDCESTKQPLDGLYKSLVYADVNGCPAIALRDEGESPSDCAVDNVPACQRAFSIEEILKLIWSSTGVRVFASPNIAGGSRITDCNDVPSLATLLNEALAVDGDGNGCYGLRVYFGTADETCADIPCNGLTWQERLKQAFAIDSRGCTVLIIALTEMTADLYVDCAQTVDPTIEGLLSAAILHVASYGVNGGAFPTGEPADCDELIIGAVRQTDPVCYGDTAVLYYDDGGNAVPDVYTYSWQWSDNDTDWNDIAGETAATYNTFPLEGGDIWFRACLTCPVTDETTCTPSIPITYNEPPAQVEVIFTNEPVCENDTLHLTASPDYASYSWTDPDGGVRSTDEDALIGSLSQADNGTWTLVATDDAGCETTTTTEVTVMQIPVLMVDETSCDSGSCDGIVDSHEDAGIGGFLLFILDDINFQVNDGHFDGLCEGSHTLQITSGDGCNSEKVFFDIRACG